MPIFEYICDDCRTAFEKVVLNREETIRCPSCGSQHYSVQFSVIAAPAKRGNDDSAAFGCGCTPTTCGCN
ncbi:MAG: zinc ribbon domain-containing protein [Acidobacteria bacterium]|nr:zinc ribbon domain-containing protein [Acidobacteriota bacterium]